MAREEVGKTDLPDVTKQRLQETLTKRATVKDGKLDVEAFKAIVEESIKAEKEYIQKLTEAGKVRGLGGSGTSGTKTLKESFREAFIRSGMNPDEAERKATIAAEGRR